jgi:predicted transposase/invertase (TIGR01784 family)
LDKGTAEMLSDYDKADKARRLRDARLKQEYEEGVRLEAAKNEGIAQGIAIGKGIVVKTLFQNGMKKEEIVKLFNLSLKEVEKYIE